MMQKRKILIANWKTYIQSFSEIDTKIGEIKQNLDFYDIDLVLCPSFIYLQRIISKLDHYCRQDKRELILMEIPSVGTFIIKN